MQKERKGKGKKSKGHTFLPQNYTIPIINWENHKDETQSFSPLKKSHQKTSIWPIQSLLSKSNSGLQCAHQVLVTILLLTIKQSNNNYH